MYEKKAFLWKIFVSNVSQKNCKMNIFAIFVSSIRYFKSYIFISYSELTLFWFSKTEKLAVIQNIIKNKHIFNFIVTFDLYQGQGHWDLGQTIYVIEKGNDCSLIWYMVCSALIYELLLRWIMTTILQYCTVEKGLNNHVFCIHLNTGISQQQWLYLFVHFAWNDLNDHKTRNYRTKFLIHKNGNHRYKYLVIGRKEPYFVKVNIWFAKNPISLIQIPSTLKKS